MKFKATFKAIEIADDACRKVGDPKGLFQALMPSPVLADCINQLYPSHVQELVQRFKDGEDMRPGTKAEVAAGLMHASLKAPLNSSGLALYEKLFKDCTEFTMTDSDLGRETYPGQLDEALEEARQKLSVPSRWIVK